MKRIALAAGLAACFGLFAAPAGADDTILRRDPNNSAKDVNLSGTIQDETPAGVKIKVGKDIQLISPEDIRYIGYDVKGAPDVDPLAFGQLHGKEDQAMSLSGDERRKALEEAMTGYKKLEKQLKSSPNAQRYVQYRMAMLAVDQAKDDPSKTAAAVEALNAFRSLNGAGWEIVPATKTVARLLEESGDKKGAQDAYDELGRNPDVPPEIRLNVNLLVARRMLQNGKYDEAEKKLSSVLADTKDEKQREYVQVYLTGAQVAQGNVKDTEKPLRDAIKAAGGDDKLRALAFNTLGDYYQQAKQPGEAFWQYLRVDVLYSQDPEEHARALYNLGKLFDTVRGDAQRSKECLDRLKDKSLEGTEYQARAIKETEAGTKSP